MMLGEMKFLLNSKLCEPQRAGVDIQDAMTQGFYRRTIHQSRVGIVLKGRKSEVIHGARGRLAGKRQSLGQKSRYLKGARTRTKEGAKKKKKVAPIPHDCNYTLHSCGSSGYCHSWVELSRSVFPKVHSLEWRRVFCDKRSCRKCWTPWSLFRETWPAYLHILKALRSPAGKTTV